MTTEPAPRLSFSTANPRMQFAWDSTSLGTFKSCPRKYEYQIVRGLRPKHGKGSHHLRYGQLYHRALEVYDHKTFEGLSHDEAIRFMLRDLAEGCTDTAEDGTRTWWNTSENLSEKKAKSNYKTVPNLFRSVIWYLEQFGKNDPAKTVKLKNGKPAVELSFRFDTDEQLYTGDHIIFSGHLDRLVEFNNQVYVLDRKTTSGTITEGSGMYYFSQFTPDNQMSLYTLASRIVLETDAVGVIIDAAQIASGFTAFARGFALRTEGNLNEWYADAMHNIRLAEGYAQANYWPMNDKSCNDYGGCTFRDICGKDPKVRDIFLASEFSNEDAWDPLKVRGEI